MEKVAKEEAFNKFKPMNKNILTIIIVLIIITAGLLTWHFWPEGEVDTPVIGEELEDEALEDMKDFHFIFRYAGNELNTKEGSYKTTIIGYPETTIEMDFLQEEKLMVYEKIEELNLFEEEIKDLGENISCQTDRPHTNYYFKTKGDVEKELKWDDCCYMDREIAETNGHTLRWLPGCHQKYGEGFEIFADFMVDMITSREEHKELPEPAGLPL